MCYVTLCKKVNINTSPKCRTLPLTMEIIVHSLQNVHASQLKMIMKCVNLSLSIPSPDCSLNFPRLFGGLILDIKRKAPFYLSDFKDGMSLQCVASFLFLYCACMSPVITFGGLLGEATEGRIVRAQTH